MTPDAFSPFPRSRGKGENGRSRDPPEKSPSVGRQRPEVRDAGYDGEPDQRDDEPREGGVGAGAGVFLFVDARNLTGKRYVSDLSTIADARSPGANTAVFYPGEGRSVYAGARVSF